MKFSEIPGQEDIKARLREIVDSGNIPHALLLEGQAGTGKFALARTFVQYLHCRNRTGGEPCGECAPCRQHAIMQHIDTLYSFPVVKEGSSTPISNDYLEEFRELMTKSPFMDFDEWQGILGANKMPVIYVAEANEIIRRMSFTGQVADHRAVLFWLPERMNTDTANKLLKYIEEPAD
ncbi:MAG: DNA polymerase III subunit delta, partial [Muribaculaceae bacterium]|nr:DNA polymerase III subunit delta [Muribaculaceae bacterium]